MFHEFIKPICKGAVKAVAITLLICAFLSLIMLYIDFSDELLSYISIALLGVLCYLSSYFSTQIKRTKGLLQGILCGGLIFVLMFILSVLSGNLSISEQLPIKAVVCLTFGIIGGVKGINTKHTKLHKR